MRLIDADALRLMKVEECAEHTIEYAAGWKACIDWIKTLPTAPHWIPVTERLPEEYGEYLVSMKNTKPPHNIFINICEGEEDYTWDAEKRRFNFNWLTDDEYEDFEVIAWLPLPAPYQGGE